MRSATPWQWLFLEETGTISIAHRGKLIRNLDGERLLNSMRAIMITDQTRDSGKFKFFFNGKENADEPNEEAEE